MAHAPNSKTEKVGIRYDPKGLKRLQEEADALKLDLSTYIRLLQELGRIFALQNSHGDITHLRTALIIWLPMIGSMNVSNGAGSIDFIEECLQKLKGGSQKDAK